MGVPVNYDVGAGEYLSTLLAQLGDKLTALTPGKATDSPRLAGDVP